MNKKETAQVMAILTIAYPNFYKNADDTTTSYAVNLWHEMFKDEPYELVQYAVKIFIASDTKGFPPVIGAIKEKIIQLTQKQEDMTELEAWEIIRKALCNCGYNYNAEWEKLPENIKAMTSAGQMHEWAMIESDDVNTVIASNFMRSYRARSIKNKEYAKLPNEIKNFLSNISEKMSMNMLENNS